ncbi:bifunctional UDP-N-acetylglucosamine diphosphorylase/glucosamine-1-phosphate N-acetyltransferase GlmU [Clostridium sp. DL1XJH146]
MEECALILAAGKGTRMKSELPKVVHKVCGKEMINHVIDNIKKANIGNINVIIGNEAEKVIKVTEIKEVSYSLQDKQLGTGHAVMCAKEFLKNKEGYVAIFTGDAPLIQKASIEELVKFAEEGNFDGVILTSLVANPFGYGRIIRDDIGNVNKIVEHKDCSMEELEVNEINSGMYCFKINRLLESLDKISNDNSQGEYYLPDVIKIIKSEKGSIGAISVPFDEIIGVNSRAQLAEAEKIMRERINNMHMDNGVTMIDPESTYIDSEVVIEADVVIYPGNVLQGETIIKSGTILYPNSRIQNSVIGKDVIIQCSVILDSSVGNDTTVGPYAYIRPESKIGNKARIGDFVEIKKSTIGDGTKVSHLTYIGDAEVGSNCNFGCGTVVVNYDGVKKYKTVVKDNVFIGCNTNLVAPVVVEENSYTAAGSTITSNVPKDALAIARAKQVNKEGWVSKKRKK